jgi:type I restriction-modification system DNA methylase subunit
MTWLLEIRLMENIEVYTKDWGRTKISKYEDYFVKRSLDSLKANGVLAMVLPSGWLNRQKN